MNKFPALFFLLIFGLSSCGKHEKSINSLYVESEQAEITSLVVHMALVSDTSFKRHLIDGYPIDGMRWATAEEKSAFLKQRKHESDSLTKQLDTAKIYVLLADTLIGLPKNYLMSKLVDEKGHQIDSLKNGIAEKWALGIIIDKKFEKFDMKNLDFKHNYRYLLHSQFKPSGGVEFFAGYLKVSSIYFNKSKDKAFVYVERMGRKGFDVFLEKKDGKWIIVKRELAWIS